VCPVHRADVNFCSPEKGEGKGKKKGGEEEKKRECRHEPTTISFLSFFPKEKGREGKGREEEGKKEKIKNHSTNSPYFPPQERGKGKGAQKGCVISSIYFIKKEKKEGEEGGRGKGWPRSAAISLLSSEGGGRGKGRGEGGGGRREEKILSTAL